MKRYRDIGDPEILHGQKRSVTRTNARQRSASRPRSGPLPAGRECQARAVAVHCERYRRRAMPSTDRVQERRRAAVLARHYREEEGLSIAEIAHRLGRAEATVKAYLYDPSNANKRPTDSPQVRQFWALAGHGRTSVCKRLLGSRCDGTRPAFPHYPICPIAATPALSSVLVETAAPRRKRQRRELGRAATALLLVRESSSLVGGGCLCSDGTGWGRSGWRALARAVPLGSSGYESLDGVDRSHASYRVGLAGGDRR